MLTLKHFKDQIRPKSFIHQIKAKNIGKTIQKNHIKIMHCNLLFIFSAYSKITLKMDGLILRDHFKRLATLRHHGKEEVSRVVGGR